MQIWYVGKQVKIYDARRNCKFHTLLVNCIKNDFKTLIRDRNRKKKNFELYSIFIGLYTGYG